MRKMWRRLHDEGTYWLLARLGDAITTLIRLDRVLEDTSPGWKGRRDGVRDLC